MAQSKLWWSAKAAAHRDSVNEPDYVEGGVVINLDHVSSVFHDQGRLIVRMIAQPLSATSLHGSSIENNADALSFLKAWHEWSQL